MSRWKTLTKTKREFLEELIQLDKKYNFLSGVEYEEFTTCLRERRYKASDSEWINKHLSEQRENYIKYKNKT